MATPEAEEFAALLRELKDRSGRSYGVLAGKLHVSTSTLHRYCNGDAVPTEYAPVERLARLCAATPDELVELHRRWILADGARRRARAEGARLPEAAEVLRPSRRCPTEPEARCRMPEAESRRAPATPSGCGSPLPRALLSPLPCPAAFVAGHAATQDQDGKGKSGAVAGASAPPGTAAPRSTSPERLAERQPFPEHLAEREPVGFTVARAARTTPPATGGVPLRVGVSSYNWDEPCGQYYLLDQAPDAVPPPPAPQDNRSWARALGGVDGGHMLLQLTATGKTADSVVLNAVHVRVVARSAPLDWKAYSMG